MFKAFLVFSILECVHIFFNQVHTKEFPNLNRLQTIETIIGAYFNL